MVIYTWVAVGFTLAGAVLMLVNVFQTRELRAAVAYLFGETRELVLRYLRLHRMLTMLFLTGYLVAVVAFVMNVLKLNEMLVGAIFLFGSVFVFLGSALQSALFHQLGKTLQGLLPMCAMCRKVRAPNADPHRPESWVPLEKYVANTLGTPFSHGYCPDCARAAHEK